ncbi:ABC transporter ATP-binding protein [Clostridium polynesiense]|uniref:ABC transporter ATP-binding protein n=1 Tax=Clostridium polynesiense TaxID=1325933 RepID=UPI00058E0B20|nr:ABC transporter ATP-binding protein [Clostridium polynesiense]
MKRIFNYVLKYKLLLFIPTIAMVCVIAADAVTPYITKLIIDRVIILKEFSILKYLLGIMMVITITKAVIGYVREYLFDVLSAKVNEDIKNDLFNHIQSLQFSYFDNMNTGELMSRIGEDVDNIWRTISFGLRLFVENIFYFLLSSIILFSLNWKLAVACISIMIPIGYIAVKLENTILKSYEEISDQAAVINTTAQENIAGVRLVKAFAREKHEILKFLKMNRTNYDLNMSQARSLAKYYPPIELLTNFSIIIMIIFGGVLVINKSMTIGTLVAFSQYIGNLIWPMRNLGWLTNMLAQNKASSKKVFDIMDTEPSIKTPENASSPESIKGDIEFKDVSFKYNDETVLRDINLKISAGSTVAVMGGTGSGKSTLLHLIGRYYDVSQGEVKVDGINVKEINLNSLRSHMSVIPEDTFLFSDSIEENIKFGKRSASMDEIETACRTACCYDFITEFEEGFDTLVGERGIGLSGGQKQRISIARALVRDASILILDDATSALDMDTEYNLLKNLNERAKQCTTFIIAHRISAVKNADKIIFLENGTILEEGTHDELLKLKGRYYEIYCEQFKDFQSFESEVV